jgi:hypothetical protein
MLPGSPLLPSARNRSLVTAFCSPATAASSRRPPFRGQNSQPATSRPSQVRFPARSALRLHYRSAGLRRWRRFQRLGPVALPRLGSAAAPTVSAPLRDSCLPRDQSVQRRLLPAGPPDEPARLPLAPRRPSWLKFGLRITVPGSLRFRRLAVPQTSWNLIHYAPDSLWRQRFSQKAERIFHKIYHILFHGFMENPLCTLDAPPVDKTYARSPDFAIL